MGADRADDAGEIQLGIRRLAVAVADIAQRRAARIAKMDIETSQTTDTPVCASQR